MNKVMALVSVATVQYVCSTIRTASRLTELNIRCCCSNFKFQIPSAENERCQVDFGSLDLVFEGLLRDGDDG